MQSKPKQKHQEAFIHKLTDQIPISPAKLLSPHHMADQILLPTQIKPVFPLTLALNGTMMFLSPSVVWMIGFDICVTPRNSPSSLVGRHRSCGNITVLSSMAFYPMKVGLFGFYSFYSYIIWLLQLLFLYHLVTTVNFLFLYYLGTTAPIPI